MSEIQLIAELKVGDQQAFIRLIDLYKHLVFNTVLNMVQHTEEAEDITQEVFIQVYQSVQTFRGDSKVSTWLYRIAITKSLDWQRKNNAKKRMNSMKTAFGIGNYEDTVPDIQHPGILLANKEKATILFKAMKKLPDNQRIAFTLIKADGLSSEEVSEIMQTSIKSLEGLMHRAKENLRKTLEQFYKS